MNQEYVNYEKKKKKKYGKNLLFPSCFVVIYGGFF